MKRTILRCAADLLVVAALFPIALATEPFPEESRVQVCYPTFATRSKDGMEIRKVCDLSPEQNPAGIPRSDLEWDGFHHTLTDLLQRELPKYKSCQHTETISLESKNKGMESVLTLLLQEKEFVTGDSLSGTLSLQLDTVQVATASYGNSTREVSTTRSYPNLASQDTANIPKSIEEDGRTLTLQNIDQQTGGTVNVSGYAMGDCCTAVATYTGTATTSYIAGYTVTTDYTDIVNRIALNRVRCVTIFEGEPLGPAVPMEEPGDGLAQFNWAAIPFPLGAVFTMGGVIGACLFLKRRQEFEEEDTG